MKYRIFEYNLPGPSEPEALNRFLGANRIVSVKEYMAQLNGGAALVFVVQYTDQAVSPKTVSGRERIDYKTVLDPARFVVFSRLREVRKKLAEADGVPVYAVFSNSQLAEMAEKEMDDLEQVKSIEGVGEARIEKYGKAVLEALLSCKTVVASQAAKEAGGSE